MGASILTCTGTPLLGPAASRFALELDACDAAPSRAVGSCVKALWHSQLAAMFSPLPPFAFFNH